MENWMKKLYSRIDFALLKGWQLVEEVPKLEQRSKSKCEK
jgi:hypothetical protein